jgi:hypothetical protein
MELMSRLRLTPRQHHLYKAYVLRSSSWIVHAFGGITQAQHVHSSGLMVLLLLLLLLLLLVPGEAQCA